MTPCPDGYNCGELVTPQLLNLTGTYTCPKDKKDKSPQPFEVHLPFYNATNSGSPAANGSTCISDGTGPIFDSCQAAINKGGLVNLGGNGSTQPYVYNPNN
jgi:hypothetical protein